MQSCLAVLPCMLATKHCASAYKLQKYQSCADPSRGSISQVCLQVKLQFATDASSKVTHGALQNQDKCTHFLTHTVCCRERISSRRINGIGTHAHTYCRFDRADVQMWSARDSYHQKSTVTSHSTNEATDDARNHAHSSATNKRAGPASEIKRA